MPRDPICGMTVLESTPFQFPKGARRYFFCSQKCMNRFMASPETEETAVPVRALVSLGLFSALFVASRFLPFLAGLHHGLLTYLKVVCWAIGLGLLLGGLIEYYIPKEYISYFLANPSKRTILRAALLGFLMSACSHGILALSMALYRKGASVSSVVSFLLASPWANLAVTFLLIGLFGMKGWILIVSAMVVAIVTGFCFQGLSRRHWVEDNPNTVSVEGGFSIGKDVRKRIQARSWTLRQLQEDAKGVLRGIGVLSEMVLPWVLLGVSLAGFVWAFVPKDLFARFFGPTFLGLWVTLLAATVIEVCSEGSSPLAFELYRSSGAFGNSFVFLMAGVITDYTEISLLWANIGKRTALWMVLLTVPQVLCLGLLFNHLF